MPKLVHGHPSYRKHRASGQAVVTVDNRDIYLGPHGTKASHAAYDRVICEWLSNGRRMPSEAADQLTLIELMRDYLRFARGYYQIRRM